MQRHDYDLSLRSFQRQRSRYLPGDMERSAPVFGFRAWLRALFGRDTGAWENG